MASNNYAHMYLCKNTFLTISGYLDGSDNCPTVAQTDQADSDGDSIGDAYNTYVSVSNPTQIDTDQNVSIYCIIFQGIWMVVIIVQQLLKLTRLILMAMVLVTPVITVLVSVIQPR